MINARHVRKIPIIVSFAMLVLIIWFANPVKLIETASTANKMYLALSILVSTIALSMRVVRWNFIVKKATFFELYPVQMLGMTVSNFTPGKIAEPAKAILLKARKGIAVSESLASIVWERIFDLIVLLVLAIFGVQLVLINNEFFIFGLIGIILVLLIVSVALLALEVRSFGLRLFHIGKKFPVLRRISDEFINTFYETKFKKTRLGLSLLSTAAAWMLDAVVLYLVLYSLGIQPDLLVLAGIISISAVLGIASSLPGGLGSTEIVMALLLGITGVPATIAVTATLLMRFISFWYNALLGGLSFVYLSKKIDIWSILKTGKK
ncbi:MAG: flippase-like domain-containing protein [Candidatus Aenigmarchaeota archaeon]|nr:flippase-like domain-containing protein [Candidatus Aenigmarchaeota archaeon]